MSTSPLLAEPVQNPGAAGPPRQLVGQVDLRTRRTADGSVLVTAAVGAVAFDAAARAGVASLGMAAGIMVVVGAVVATRRIASPQAIAVLVLAPVVGAFLALRSSPWVVGPDVLAVAGLLGLAASLGGGGSLMDLSVPRAVGRVFVTGAHLLLAPGYALGALAGRRAPRSWAPAIRGLGLAAPVVVVTGLLLRSADAVFASFFRIPTDVGDLAAHGLLLLTGAWLVTGLLRGADAVQEEPAPARRPGLGHTEARFVLGGLVAVLGGFAVAQVVATTVFGDRVLRDAGLTFADHARSGFFQLLAVAALTLVVLLSVRACAEHDSALASLGVAAVALTLVVVGVALHRLGAYRDAYGLTMLRLASTAFAWWIGAVFLVVGARLAGAGRGRHWLLGVAGGMALAALLIWNLANPEAIVVRHDIERAAAGKPVDLTYLAGLSDDAVPSLVEGLSRLDPNTASAARAALCAGSPATMLEPGPSPFAIDARAARRRPSGALGWNAGKVRAGAAIRDLCASGSA